MARSVEKSKYWWTLFNDAVILLILTAGVVILIYGVPGFNDKQTDEPYSLEKQSQLEADEANFPLIGSYYHVDTLEHYSLGQFDQGGLLIQVAHYTDARDKPYSAIVYEPAALANTTEITPLETQLQALRQQAWNTAFNSIRQGSDQNSLFLTWWDNAQRVHLYTGRNTWAQAPLAEAFSSTEERALWHQLGGGFADNDEHLKQLARWLSMDAEQALDEIRTRIQQPEYYFLVSMDDLVRLSEISALSGQTLPFETRLFSPGDNIHTLISGVKQWANEKGNGHYLVQKLPAGRVRAWRISRAEGENTLLARLLPFTASLANPLSGTELVYRSSDWSGYLSVHRISPVHPL